MTVEDTAKSAYQSLLSTTSPIIKSKISDATSFADTLQSQIKTSLAQTTSSSVSSTSSENDEALQSFLDDLKSKGALAFYQDYNFEKIQKLIDEKKAELTESLGLNDTSSTALSGDARQQALSNLDDMLDAFRKQLQEKMQAQDEQNKQNTVLSTFLQNLS